MPEPYRVPKPKANIALEEIDRLLAVGVRFGCVLSDAGYGISAAFRQGLDARQRAWAVSIPRIQKVYPAEIEMIWPSAGRGRPRGIAIPAEDGVAAECILAGKAWQAISWRNGTKGPLSAEFAAIRVRVADGPAVYPDQGKPASPRCRGVAGGRAPGLGRTEVLPFHPSAPARLCGISRPRSRPGGSASRRISK